MTLSLIQLTDLHIARPARLIDGCQTTTHQTLDTVLDSVKQEDFDAVLCTGDITDAPHEGAYRDAFERLATLQRPVYCLPGNHDDAAMAAPLARDHGLQWDEEVRLGDWQLVFLDSSLDDDVHGGFSTRELERLDDLLIASNAPHTLVTLHHHPVPTESLWMDKLMLQRAGDLFDVLDRHTNIRGLLWGHIHQEFDQLRNGVRLLGSPSTSKQFTRFSEHYSVDASLPPAFRRLRLKPTGEIETEVHYCH